MEYFDSVTMMVEFDVKGLSIMVESNADPNMNTPRFMQRIKK